MPEAPKPATPYPHPAPASAPHPTLVLLGAGQAHLQLLSKMAQAPWVGVQVVLVTPFEQPLHAALVPHWVAGHCALGDCSTALEPLVQRSGMRWIQSSAQALDAAASTLTLDDGSSLRFNALSINTPLQQDRARLEAAMPGARAQGLFVYPLEVFGTLWPQVAAMGDARALRIAVIGADTPALELAMALRCRLPSAALTLLGAGIPPGSHYPAAVQARIQRALQQRNITVLHDSAVALRPGEVVLSSGATLACDVPVLSTGAQPPEWLQHSGLALDAQGGVAVDACLRSTSHPQVFTTGETSRQTSSNAANPAASTGRAGAVLAKNLAASLAGQALVPYRPATHPLQLISCGNRTAIASWGRYSAQGRWVGWLKERMDRGWVGR